MHQAFIEAFSDYSVPFTLDLAAFQAKFIEKLHLDFGLSCGAFDRDRLVGFIFTSVAEYEGRKTAYNGGTGVLPAYRGRQLTSSMYESLLRAFRQAQIQQSVLEVITDNERALTAYGRVGFRKSRHFHCFKLKESFQPEPLLTEELEFVHSSAFDWRYYEMFKDTSPSFLDSPENLKHHLKKEFILYVRKLGQTVAYAIFQPQNGRISQLAVSKAHRQQQIGRALIAKVAQLAENPRLTVLNVDSEQSDLIAFLEKAGFVNEIDQYEMRLRL